LPSGIANGIHGRNPGLERQAPQFGGSPARQLTKKRTLISTHESPEAAVAAHGDVGPVFRHDTNETATVDRLRQLWQSGAHDITLTFSDDTPLPPAPGHTDR